MATRQAAIRLSLRSGAFQSEIRKLTGQVRGAGLKMGAALKGPMTAGLGVFYESFNLAFPVWHWTSLEALPPAARTAVMMAIGYIVLIHPMFIALRLAAPPARP